MTQSKPGLFGRIKRAISSSLTQAVDAVSDPGQEIALMLDDLDSNIKQAEKNLHQAMVDRKVMERKCLEFREESGGWHKKAEQAIKGGDENLAREALERKSRSDQRLQATEESLREQAALVENMRSDIERSKEKLKALNLRRGTLMAQARAAKQAQQDEEQSSYGSGTGIDAVEAKIAEIEAANEVAAELGESKQQQAAVEAKFAQLDEAASVDRELEELKKRMQGNRALSEGKS